MEIEVPGLSLIVLIGASGSGKSTFGARHFAPTEVVSSDVCRAMICDDAADQEVSGRAFHLLHTIVRERLQWGRLTVVDATHLTPQEREPLLGMAKKYQVPCVAIVLNLPLDRCIAQDASRPGRVVGKKVVTRQRALLHKHLAGISEEGFSDVHLFTDEARLERACIIRLPLACDKRDLRGPFDIIGDVHGCLDELKMLLEKLGYEVKPLQKRDGISRFSITPPSGRTAIFVGDLVDRGPENLSVLTLVMDMTQAGCALSVPGNHEAKLLRHLQGKKVNQKYGLERTIAELALVDDGFHEEACAWIEGLTSHFVLDEGKLVVAHAGLKAHLQGKQSGKAWRFALYGETTGETDEFGFPVRCDWAENYLGEARVVYGHTPVLEAEWVNRTICIDTGCVFGGKLTALRYPELELVEVPAWQVYYPRAKPLESRRETS